MKQKQRTVPLSGLYRRHPCQALPLMDAILACLEGEVPKHARTCLSMRDWSGYVSMKVDPSTFTDASDFRDAYLACELLSKFPDFDLGIDRAGVALEKFLSSELDCAETNNRLIRSYGTPSTSVSYASVIYTARRKIGRILGPFSWDSASQFFGFGPGASYALKRKYGDAYHKFGILPEVTKECAALAHAMLKWHPGWLNHLASLSGKPEPLDNLVVVEGNRITTVPKNAKTDRVIAIEPLLNMYFQKGIGGLIRRKLSRVGVDLNDQSHNQKLAKEGSVTGQLATIDLSSASDSVSIELTRQLLPPDWFLAVEQVRSSVGVLPSGEKITYQKVSSMGNGCTFELESLFFYALCSSVCDLHGIDGSRVSVYGDDIIIPTDAYGLVREALSFSGFTLNEKKSFSAGPFRESCGKHYFMGHDVTPFYIREAIDRPDRLILALNNLRRFAARLQPWGLDGRFQCAYDEFRRSLPSWFRKPRIPDGYGDGALFGDFSEVRPRAVSSSQKHRHWEGWQFDNVTERRRAFCPDDYPILLRALYSLENRKGNGEGLSMSEVVIPQHKPCYKLQKSVAPQWENKGDWL